MGKQNAYLAKLQAQKEAEIAAHRKFTINWCADAAILAANEVFQRRGKKLAEFRDVYMRYAHEIAEMTMDDAKADKSLEYTKYKLDERLKDLLGEDFKTWDERYTF